MVMFTPFVVHGWRQFTDLERSVESRVCCLIQIVRVLLCASCETTKQTREETVATYVRSLGAAVRSVGRVLRTVRPAVVRNPAILSGTKTMKTMASRVRIASRASLKETVNTPDDPHARSKSWRAVHAVPTASPCAARGAPDGCQRVVAVDEAFARC